MKKIVVSFILIVIFLFLFIIIFKGKSPIKIGLITNVKESYTYKNFIKKDTLLLLNYWASWCEPCIEEIPLLNSIKHKYSEGVNFISFSQDRDTLKAINAHKNNNFLWEEISVVDYKYQRSLKSYLDKNKIIVVNELPKTYLIKNGVILMSFSGKLDSIQISTAIDKYK